MRNLISHLIDWVVDICRYPQPKPIKVHDKDISILHPDHDPKVRKRKQKAEHFHRFSPKMKQDKYLKRNKEVDMHEYE